MPTFSRNFTLYIYIYIYLHIDIDIKCNLRHVYINNKNYDFGGALKGTSNNTHYCVYDITFV